MVMIKQNTDYCIQILEYVFMVLDLIFFINSMKITQKMDSEFMFNFVPCKN